MHQEPISRREAGARILAITAAAGLAPMALGRRQPAGGGGGGGGQPPMAAGAPDVPYGTVPPGSPLDGILVRSRQHDWTLKVDVNVDAYEYSDSQGMPRHVDFKIATAAVVFPVIPGSASSGVYTDEVKGEIQLNDRTMDQSMDLVRDLHSGTRLGRWEFVDAVGRELELHVEIPSSCYRLAFDEAKAWNVPWSKTLPPEAMSTFDPQMGVDYQNEPIPSLVKQWTGGKDPKTVPPVQLAKFLAGKVIEHAQPTGTGLSTADNGLLEGVALQAASVTAAAGRGSEHDIAALLAAVYRAAGLPARTVIGLDMLGKEGDGTFLTSDRGRASIRSWVEFCIANDESSTWLWVPVDPARLRGRSSRPPRFDKPWPKYFGTFDEFDSVIPFAFHYHPPIAGPVAHGAPSFWGWFTTPRTQSASQFLRFAAQTTSKRSNEPRRPPGDDR